MKIQNISQSFNFKGYKNIVSNTIKDKEDGRLCYMAMELNNDGENDLDKWIQIQKELLNKKEPSKYLTITTTLTPPNGHPYETRAFESVEDFVLNLNIQKQLKPTLKAYTLLASLTKRIFKEEFHPEDENLKLTYDALYKSLEKDLYEEFAEFLVENAKRKTIDHKITAKNINKQIDKNLKIYFSKVL